MTNDADADDRYQAAFRVNEKPAIPATHQALAKNRGYARQNEPFVERHKDCTPDSTFRGGAEKKRQSYVLN